MRQFGTYCLLAACLAGSWVLLWGGPGTVDRLGGSTLPSAEGGGAAKAVGDSADAGTQRPTRERSWRLREQGSGEVLANRRVKVNGEECVTTSAGMVFLPGEQPVHSVTACVGDPAWTDGQFSVVGSDIDVSCFGCLRIVSVNGQGIAGSVLGKLADASDLMVTPFAGSSASVRVGTARSWVVRVDSPSPVVVVPGSPEMVGSEGVSDDLKVIKLAKKPGLGVAESAPLSFAPGETREVSVEVLDLVTAEVVFDELDVSRSATVTIKRLLRNDEAVVSTWMPVLSGSYTVGGGAPAVVMPESPRGRFRVTMRSTGPGEVVCAMWDEDISRRGHVMRQSRQVERHSLRIASRERFDGLRRSRIHIAVEGSGSIIWRDRMACDCIVRGLPAAVGEIDIEVDGVAPLGFRKFDVAKNGSVIQY